MTELEAIVAAAGAAAWTLLLAPSVVYLGTGWRQRRDRLWDFLTGDVLRIYYQLFDPKLTFGNDEQYEEHFQKLFVKRYGPRHFWLPVILLALLAGIGLFAVWATILGRVALPPIVPYAIMGSYLWVVWDQLNRLRSRDFTTYDIYGCSFRFVIGVPLGIALASLATNTIGPALAFLVGAFPTTELFRIVRRNAGKPLGLDETGTAEAGPTELVKLQGISRGIAERFQEEGFTTIAQLAWTEPVDLAIRTNMDFDYVVDCQSQALLWAYFEDRSRSLAPFMLRGAMEAAEMLGSPSRGGPRLDLAPRETLVAAAKTVGMEPEVFGQTLLEVAKDPYTQILCAIWYPDWFEADAGGGAEP